MIDPRPLIVTLELEPAAFVWFDALRRAHFPPERNVVPAHLTLFHALPGEQEAAVRRALTQATKASPPLLHVAAPRSLGRGVAYNIVSPELLRIRGELAATFEALLTRQDHAPFRPHVTVQNKVEPAEAAALLERLQHEFEPFEARGEALLLWRYLGGPWGAEGRYAFAG